MKNSDIYLIKKLFLPVLFTFLIVSHLNAVPLNPFINGVSPDINSLNAGRSENIIVYFSQDMDPTTINSSGIIVYGYSTGYMNTVIAYDPGSKKVTIDPVNNFKTGECINVSIDSLVKTVANVPVDPVSYIFTVASSRGDGFFTGENSLLGGFTPGSMLSGDFDGDGAVDFVSINSDTRLAAFIKNNGNGVFTLSNSFLIDTAEIKCFSSADYDNDGDIDLSFIIGEYFIFDLQIFLNNGNGIFTPGHRKYFQTSGRVGAVHMKSIDMDNDGNIDLLPLSNDRFAGGVSILFNNGNAEFPFERFMRQSVCNISNYPLVGRANSFTVTDVNNDGSKDVIIESSYITNGNIECYAIRVMKNNGHRSFSILSDYEFPNQYNSIISSEDFDNDGYSDILCTGFLMKNNGSGYFTVIQGYSISNGIAGDFDADGDLDVVSSENNSVNLYKNNGDGTFSTPVNFETGIGSGGVWSGNFDNDCDLDIVSLNNYYSYITVLKNSSETDYCSLSGPELNLINTENILYTTSDRNGYWEIFNNPPCNAVINGSNQDDSVFVNAGSSPGEFILYHHSFDDCGWKSCSKAVNVDNPTPVEIAAFVSVVIDNNVILKWTTVTETNNSGFEVERRDVIGETQDVWKNIAFINGSGTTTSPNNYEFTDRNLSSGKYNYRLKQIDFNGNYEYYDLNDEVVIGIPDKFSLSQNYPNPFNPVTKLEFGISDMEFVSLKVYDIAGKEVMTLVNETKPAGRYMVIFDGSNLGSGVYYYKIEAGNFSAVKRMILLK